MSVRAKLEEIKEFLLTKLEEVAAEAEKIAPAVEAGAVAVAAAVPGVAPVAAVVEKVAETVAGVVACCEHAATAPHLPNGCTAPGCTCAFPPIPAPAP
jgi:hypothetical protein